MFALNNQTIKQSIDKWIENGNEKNEPLKALTHPNDSHTIISNHCIDNQVGYNEYEKHEDNGNTF